MSATSAPEGPPPVSKAGTPIMKAKKSKRSGDGVKAPGKKLAKKGRGKHKERVAGDSVAKLEEKPAEGAAVSTAAPVKNLSPVILNNEIILMRKHVRASASRLYKELTWQIHNPGQEKGRPSIELDTVQVDKEVNLFKEEMDILKEKVIQRDDVIKFAIVNKKSRRNLDINETMPVVERVLKKLACEKYVVDAVKKFRKKYTDWESQVPFMLQRLGKQYQQKKEQKQKQKQKKEAKSVDGSISSTNAEETSTENMISKISEKAESIENRRKEKKDADLKKAAHKAVLKETREAVKESKKKLKKERPVAQPVILKDIIPESTVPDILRRGEAVIRRLKLDADDCLIDDLSKEEDESKPKISQITMAPESDSEASGDEATASSFFLTPGAKDVGFTGSASGSEEQSSSSDLEETDEAHLERMQKEAEKRLLVQKKGHGNNKQTRKTRQLTRHNGGSASADRSVGPPYGGSAHQKQQPTLDRRALPPKKLGQKRQAAVSAPEEEHLHPSWIAKKKMREQLQGLAPQGKKIVFADD